MSKYGPCWLHLCIYRTEASADRTRVYHSSRENSVSSSSHFRDNTVKPIARESTRKPFALFSNTRKSSQEALSDRGDFSLEHQQGPGNNEPLFRFSDPETSVKSFFEEHKDKYARRGNSEVRKQESRADFLDSSVRDLQRQLDSNHLEILCTNLTL